MEPLTGNPFLPYLASRGHVVLDGGLATALEAGGHSLDDALWSARLLVDAPQAVRSAHLAFLEAGADCITTVSYQASIQGFVAAGFAEVEAEALLRRSTELAVEARRLFAEAASTPPAPLAPLVAASIGPYGAYLADGSEYDGRYDVSASDLRAFHSRRFGLLADSGADILACETIPSGPEAAVLLDLLEAHGGVWAWMSFACRDERSLHDGTAIEDVVRACARHERVAAIGVNCTDPRHVGPLITRAAAVTDRPLLVYPNSGETYDAATRQWVGPTSGWLEGVGAAVDAGARVVGGCCRIGTEGIRELRRAMDAGDWAASPTPRSRR